jgi:hypothetical protein
MCPDLNATVEDPLKHPSIHRFLAYWNRLRGNAQVPELAGVDPNMLRELVNDGFVLSRADHYSFGFAGTQLCTRFGRNLANQEFSTLFDAGSRREAEEVVTLVEDEAIPVVAGIAAMGGNGTRSHLELLLLPFAGRAPASINVAGVLLPFEINADVLSEPVLSSWRYVHPSPQICASRAVRKHSIADGLAIYSGTASL